MASYRNNLPKAGGVAIKSIQRGVLTFTNQNQLTAALSQVVTANCVIRIWVNTVDLNSLTSCKTMLVNYSLSQSSLTLSRALADGVALNVQWEVLEYESGVSIQRGVTNLQYGSATVTISAIDTARSQVVMNVGSVAGTTTTARGSTSEAMPYLTSFTGTSFTAKNSSGVGPTNLQWQVVTHE
ncbi:hypothetical protein [Aeromonas dhakensis]|uniref:hypothetical protein n=1 Tax=Aeromonas dhakensis TaxID=196024 RepID=UPI0039B77F38